MSTSREQYHALQKQTGYIAPELKISLKAEYLYLWNLFAKLMKGCPVDYVGIEAYCRLTGVKLMGYEIDILVELKDAYWSIMNE